MAMNGLLRRLVLARRGRQWQKFERATQRPRDTQEALLDRLIRRNADTQFGRDHGFARLRGLDDYRRAVPIADFRRFQPYVDRVVNGERGILTAQDPFMFNISSGTSGTPKLIPVTPDLERDSARLRSYWGYRALRDHPGLLDGVSLGMVFPDRVGVTPGGLPYGALSGHVYRHTPATLRRRYALPYEVAEIPDLASKYYVAMRLALPQNVTFLFTTNPYTIQRLAETADAQSESLLRDIHDGTLAQSFRPPAPVLEAIAPGLRADPEAARRLATLAERRGRLAPMDYWPDTRLLGCWTGGPVGQAGAALKDWFAPGLVMRDLGLGASEAMMSLPIADGTASGVLSITSNVYEFVPEEEMGSDSPSVLGAHELEVGRLYNIVMTTPGGLYRYDINDVVRVTGHHNQTPMIEFARKGRDASSLIGEKLSVDQLIAAIDAARAETGLRFGHWNAWAATVPPHYVLQVEFLGETPPEPALRAFLVAVDKALAKVNVSYAKHRHAEELPGFALHAMRPGWFDRLYAAAIAGGARDGQYKPHLLVHEPAAEAEIARRLDAAA